MKKENILKKSNIVYLMLIFTFSLVFTSVFCFNAFAQAEKVTLKVFEWETTEQLESMEACFKAFEEQNPDIKLEVETSDYESFARKSLIASEAGMMPDCIEISSETLLLAKRGHLVDLQPFIDKEPEGFLDSYVAVEEMKDYWTRTYSYLPLRINVVGFYMVEEYLKEAGFTEPPKTWEEFEEVLKKCTIEGERYGYVASVLRDEYSQMIANSFGGVFENPDGTSGLANPETIAAIEFHLRMLKNYGPEGVAMFGAKESRDVFMNGDAAITLEGNWMNNIFKYNMKPGLTWMPFLTPVKDVPTAHLTGAFYGIGTGTEHPEEAWRFIKFMTGPEADRIMFELGQTLPKHRVNLLMPEIQSDPVTKVFADQLLNAERVWFLKTKKTFNTFMQYHKEYYQKILYGEMTAEEAMKALAKKIDEESAQE